MAYIKLSDFQKKYTNKDLLTEVTYEIISLIKDKKLKKALFYFEKNNLSFLELISRTQRLKTEDFCIFIDYVISHYKK